MCHRVCRHQNVEENDDNRRERRGDGEAIATPLTRVVSDSFRRDLCRPEPVRIILIRSQKLNYRLIRDRTGGFKLRTRTQCFGNTYIYEKR